jgi:hypothetical protein
MTITPLHAGPGGPEPEPPASDAEAARGSLLPDGLLDPFADDPASPGTAPTRIATQSPGPLAAAITAGDAVGMRRAIAMVIGGSEETDAQDLLRGAQAGSTAPLGITELSDLMKGTARGEPRPLALLSKLADAVGVDFVGVAKSLGPSPSYDDIRGALLCEYVKDAVLGVDWMPMEGLLESTAGPENRAAHDAIAARMCGVVPRARDWIGDDANARGLLDEVVRRAAPYDPGIDLNKAASAAVDSFKEWDRYPYSTVIVPGYSDDSQGTSMRLNPQAQSRCDCAYDDWKAGLAPFILVSGGAVHPPGTPYYEGVEMRDYLVNVKHVPPDRVIVDARARHSTTNLRNAGRYMLEHHMPKPAMIQTSGAQDFYYGASSLSSFDSRCQSELGYEPGVLDDNWYSAGDVPHPVSDKLDPSFHNTLVSVTAFTPSADCFRTNLDDPLDP